MLLLLHLLLRSLPGSRSKPALQQQQRWQGLQGAAWPLILQLLSLLLLSRRPQQRCQSLQLCVCTALVCGHGADCVRQTLQEPRQR